MPDPLGPATDCPLCGSDGAVPLYPVDGWSLARCGTCALAYRRPLPTASELAALYDEGYYHTGRGYAAQEREDVPTFAGHLARIARECPRKGRLLDVGCNRGLFLRMAREGGWAVAGAELSPADARHAREAHGLDVFCGPVTEAPWEPGRFAAATLLDVIEHLPDPGPVLRRIRTLLAPNGLLFLVTGNAESARARALGPAWGYLRRPGHIVFYSPGTIRRALEEAGFRGIAVELSLLDPTADARLGGRWLRRLRGLANRRLGGLKRLVKGAAAATGALERLGGEGMLVTARAPAVPEPRPGG